MTHVTKVRTGTLDDIATDSHVFSIIAMDQRNTLRRMFTAVGVDASDDDLRTAKADVARVLTPIATGLLSDPTYGVPAITQAQALAPARALNDLDIDLLKLEYPGSAAGCRRLAAVLRRPWAVLSAGVPFDQFTDVIQIAFDEGGASGFIAGRSVWREVVSLAGQERERFLATVARPRLERLVEVAGRRARPWTEMGGSRLREVGTAATA